MTLDNETPSAMVEQYYSLPYDAYAEQLYAYLMIGTACGAAITLAVVFVLLALAQPQVQS